MSACATTLHGAQLFGPFIETLARLPPTAVLMADPPWSFGDALGKRGAEANYPVMTLDEIKAFPLPPLADNCLLLLWRVAAMQQEALDVVRAWGFVVKSEIIWNKLTKKAGVECAWCKHVACNQHFGMGRYVRAAHETCLVATRGRVAVADHAVRSSFTAPVRAHSRKPEEIYTIANRLVPHGPRVELFARFTRPGWTTIGNQLRRGAGA